MQTSRKIIYWVSLALIFVFVIIPFVGQFTPLEITNHNFQSLFEQLRFFGLPIVILLTLFGTIKPKDTPSTKTTKIILTICVSLLSVYILFMSIWAGMCSWTNNKVLFNNVNDKTIKIVLRDFGCGATDSGSPTYKVCKIKNILPSLIWVTEIDTTKIDRQIWQRVVNREWLKKKIPAQGRNDTTPKSQTFPAPCSAILPNTIYFKNSRAERSASRVLAYHAAEFLPICPTHPPCSNNNSDAPLATGALARQKQRSICFCLDFLLHFFIKKKVEIPQSKTLLAISTTNNHFL